jgi:hypothetical protein
VRGAGRAEPAAQATALRACSGGELHPERLELEVDPGGLARVLLGGAGRELGTDATQPADDTEGSAPITISVPTRLRRSGKEVALVIGERGGTGHASTPLARLVAEAHRLGAALISGEVLDLDALARREGMGRTYLIRLLRLAYLAPEIVEAILAGCEPDHLTVNYLMKAVQLPLAWDQQRRMLGLA